MAVMGASFSSASEESDDGMKQDWLFSTETAICDVRTAGVLIQQDRLLVQREVGGRAYALPGGHLQIGETLEAGLIREFREETGMEIACRRMLWSEECFWHWRGKLAHNLCFYYLIERNGGAGLSDLDQFTPHKDNPQVETGWLPIDRIGQVVIYPSFLKEELACLDGRYVILFSRMDSGFPLFLKKPRRRFLLRRGRSFPVFMLWNLFMTVWLPDVGQ